MDGWTLWFIACLIIYVGYVDVFRPYARQFSKTLGARSARRILPDAPKKVASQRQPKRTTKPKPKTNKPS